MAIKRNVSGVWVAVPTPLNSTLDCDAARLAAHCRFLFDHGCDGVAIFGTTGEGTSFSAYERRKTLDLVLKAGIPAGRILLGTGSAALTDAAELNRAAADAELAGALMLPPFYWKNVDGEGVFRSFAQAIARTGAPAPKIYLYHIPPLSAVAMDLDTIGRLATEFPGVIVGIKDSTLDWGHTEPLLKRFAATLEVMVGAENHLPQAMAAGASGTICGLANIAPGLVRALCDAPNVKAAAGDLQRIGALIDAVEGLAFVPAVKAIAAAQKGDDGWLACRAPLYPLPPAQTRALREAVARLAIEPALAA